VRDDVVSSTIQLISDSPSELQASITADFWRELAEDKLDRQPLVQIAMWSIGEYGDILLYDSEHGGKVRLCFPLLLDLKYRFQWNEDEILDGFQRILWAPQNTIVTKQYALMSLIKLSTRFRNANNRVCILHALFYILLDSKTFNQER